MEKKTVGVIATIAATLLFGITGLIVAFAVGIPALFSSMPSMQLVSLGVPGVSTASNFDLLGSLGGCCICIPIPLAVGFFALHRQVKASVSGVEESLS